MGILPLEVSEDDGTKVLDEEQFEEIKRVVPFLLKIIDKPRSFIKSLEEKVPVETAKKINHKGEDIIPAFFFFSGGNIW